MSDVISIKQLNIYLKPRLEPELLQNVNVILCNWHICLPTPLFKTDLTKPLGNILCDIIKK